MSSVDFAEWYDLVRPGLLAALTSWCGDASVATDAVDEAFVRAVERWPKVSQTTSPEGWVWRTATNVVRRRMRRRSMELRLVRHDAPVLHLEPRDPELVAALQQLTERQRTAVVLHHVADRPVAEVAQMLGITPGTVTATLHQARTRLAELLQPDPEPEPTTRIDGALS